MDTSLRRNDRVYRGANKLNAERKCLSPTQCALIEQFLIGNTVLKISEGWETLTLYRFFRTCGTNYDSHFETYIKFDFTNFEPVDFVVNRQAFHSFRSRNFLVLVPLDSGSVLAVPTAYMAMKYLEQMASHQKEQG